MPPPRQEHGVINATCTSVGSRRLDQALTADAGHRAAAEGLTNAGDVSYIDDAAINTLTPG